MGRASSDGPPVTVSGAPAGVPAVDDPPRPTWPLLAGGAAVLAAALVVAELVSPAAAPPDPVRAELRLAARDVAASRSGVLVLPVDVVNRGPAVRLLDARAQASPVASESATSGRTRVDAGGTGRVVALVQPDCAALPSTGLRVTLTLILRTDERAERRLSVDLGRDPEVARHVAGVCGATGRPGPAAAARR